MKKARLLARFFTPFISLFSTFSLLTMVVIYEQRIL